MAKENNKQNKNQDKDGKGKSGCCAGCLGCGVLFFIAFILAMVFVCVPVYQKYEDDISSNTFVNKLRNALGDKIDEWNFRYIRPAQEKAMELQQRAEDIKSDVKDVIDNPKLIIEKAENLVDEPLLDD